MVENKIKDACIVWKTTSVWREKNFSFEVQSGTDLFFVFVWLLSSSFLYSYQVSTNQLKSKNNKRKKGATRRWNWGVTIYPLVGCSLHYTTHQGGERGHCNGSSTTSPSTLLSPLSSSSTSTSSPLVSSYLHHHRHHHNLLPLALCYNFYPNISIAISDLESGENNQSSERFLMIIKQLELKYICQQQNIHSKIVKVCRACFPASK